MFQKKFLGFAAIGALSLSGCGLFELADAIQDAAEDAASQVKVAVTKQNVKGSLTAISAAFKGLDALGDIGGGAGAPGLLAQVAETTDCSGGGSVTMDEAEDGSSFSITADNCVEESEEGTLTANGTMTFEQSGDYESGSMSFSYTANLDWTLTDANGNVIEQFSFSDFSMSYDMTMDQTAGTYAYDYTVNGTQTIVDDSGTNSLTFSNFRMKLASTQDQMSAEYSIDGGFTFDLADGNCTDGAFTFETTTPLVISESADCPTAGVLAVNGVTYTFDGDTITATSGDASESFSCGEVAGDDQCSFEDEEEDEFPEDDTSETM